MNGALPEGGYHAGAGHHRNTPSRGSRRAGALVPPWNPSVPVRGRVPQNRPPRRYRAAREHLSLGNRRAGCLGPAVQSCRAGPRAGPPKTTRHTGTHSPIFYIAIPIPHFSPNRHGLRTMPVFVGVSSLPSLQRRKNPRTLPCHCSTWNMAGCLVRLKKILYTRG